MGTGTRGNNGNQRPPLTRAEMDARARRVGVQSTGTQRTSKPRTSPQPAYRGKRRRRMRKGPIVLLLLLVLALLLLLVKYNGETPAEGANPDNGEPVTVSPLTKAYTIGLDPGHGGKDLGAEGYVKEVDLTEMTTGHLKAILEDDGRFRVVLSRKNGEKKGISDRRDTLNKAKPDLVLSIHGNSDTTGTASGFECYPTPPGRDNHEESLAFARLLAKEMIAIGADVRGTDSVYYAYYDVDKDGNDVKIIKDSTDNTVSTLGSFGMVEKFQCPAVLVEQCFVNNKKDMERFGDKAGSKKVAQAYYLAICKALSIEAK